MQLFTLQMQAFPNTHTHQPAFLVQPYFSLFTQPTTSFQKLDFFQISTVKFERDLGGGGGTQNEMVSSEDLPHL